MNYRNAWLAVAARAARVCVDYHPAEECPYASDYFDVVVMINVLDHVQDARRCLEQAIRITRTDGLLLFGQDLTLATDEQPANPGHPFVLNHQQLEPLLLSRFKPVLKRIVPRVELSEPEMHYGALVFAGRKLGTDHL
jgi:ubiquinone/menaquinone biosynthesis C-methylase UbiE